MNEKLLELFKSMDDSDIVNVWNEYCYASNSYDDEILDYDRLEDLIKCDSQNDAFYWINRFFYGSDDYSSDEASANPNRNYFTFNGYGNIVSFDYIYNSYSEEFNHIDIDALIDYIVENKESFYNDDIQEIIDEEENEED